MKGNEEKRKHLMEVKLKCGKYEENAQKFRPK
jgi:hypothetical protein